MCLCVCVSVCVCAPCVFLLLPHLHVPRLHRKVRGRLATRVDVEELIAQLKPAATRGMENGGAKTSRSKQQSVCVRVCVCVSLSLSTSLCTRRKGKGQRQRKTQPNSKVTQQQPPHLRQFLKEPFEEWHVSVPTRLGNHTMSPVIQQLRPTDAKPNGASAEKWWARSDLGGEGVVNVTMEPLV